MGATPPQHDRRSFLGWAVHGLGAIFAVFIGVPIVAYVIDPRNRKGSQGDFKLADGVRLTDLTALRPVQQGVLRDIRRDAWTLHPNDVLGRIWVVLQPDKTVPANPERRATMSDENSGDVVKVFTTICPHLGCSVNLNADGKSFTCPCHTAEFHQDGSRGNVAHNPANRGLDELRWRVDPDDPEKSRLLVRYRNFKSTEAEKIEIA